MKPSVIRSPADSNKRFFKLSGLILAALIQFGLHNAAHSQDYTPISNLGTSEAVCAGGVENVEQLQSFFADNPETIQQILDNSGWGGDKADLDAAIASGVMVEKAYEPGSRFHWMSAKRKDTGVALPFREWSGKESFLGYEIKVTSQCQIYTLVIPKICCNLSLMSFEPEPVEAPSVIASTSDESTTLCTEPGSIVSILHSDGSSIDAPLDSNGCWASTLPPGDYQIKAINPHCSGAESLTPLTVDAPEVIAVDPEPNTIIPFVSVFLASETRMRYEPSWDMDMKDSSGVYGFRAGIMHPYNDDLTVFGQLSIIDRTSINEGNIYPESSLSVDVGVDRKVGKRGFIGAGFGLWNIDDNGFRDRSYFVHGGRYLGESNTQWFIEARLFDDDLDDVNDNNMVSVGLRFLYPQDR